MKNLVFIFVFLMIGVACLANPSDRKTPGILDMRGMETNQLDIGKSYQIPLEELPAKFQDSLISSRPLWVYLGEVSVARLQVTTSGNREAYRFLLPPVTPSGDALSSIFGTGNKNSMKAQLFLGHEFQDRIPITGTYTISFDEERGEREWWVIPSAVIVGLLFFTFAFKGNRIILRDGDTSLAIPPYSLSRVQFTFWTLLVLIAFFTVWINTGSIPHITSQVLTLLGISAATRTVGHVIDSNDVVNPIIKKRHQEDNSSGSFLPNILSDHEGLSAHRLQQVLFTLAIGSYFLFEVFQNNQIPVLDNNLVVLMGVSSATYLGIKQGENKVFQKKVAEQSGQEAGKVNDTARS